MAFCRFLSIYLPNKLGAKVETGARAEVKVQKTVGILLLSIKALLASSYLPVG